MNESELEEELSAIIYLFKAVAIFVRGPKVMIVTSFGFSSRIWRIASIAEEWSLAK
jgi:hypothetical protein